MVCHWSLWSINLYIEVWIEKKSPKEDDEMKDMKEIMVSNNEQNLNIYWQRRCHMIHDF